ncbi:conjugal transfer protein TrbH [Xylophilus ampelinus]|uniref:Conjugative transfer protein TrbH n=1 Tax=Xylophilus ampelinus TaxID=54067 RepID=A0A318SBM8_9BURK|nr:conjugal transfer protein TrbH [Xylophilus ampelinus]MCS4511831.1 conjugal transfer protein TrbH [Xylophilus ampelinus]PYE73363.1 conjugative transfer protein TrbH [Xylophilus ampelinus]
MRKIVSLALFALALGLGGCATTSSPYGNFVQSATLDQQKLATDAVQQLATLYAPARTRLELQQPTPDPFGQALVKSLRDKGYAVLEFVPAGASAQAPASAASQPSAAATKAAADGLSLRYVLDQAGDATLYRLTLMVGSQSITRPYLAQNGAFAPAGYWVRKE